MTIFTGDSQVRQGADVTVFHPYLHPDVIVYPDEGTVFEPGTVVVGRQQDLRPGAGAYTGSMLHRLGHHVSYLDRVGTDLFGRMTLTILEQWGHDISGVIRYEGDTQVCMSIADAASLGGSMVITYPPAWQQSFDEILSLARKTPTEGVTYQWSWYWSFAHQTLKGAPTHEIVAELADRAATLMLDPNWKPAGVPPEHELAELRASLRYLDILKPNLRDAQLLVGDIPLDQIPGRLLEFGPKIVVVTAGEQGCVVASQKDKGEAVRIANPDLPVRDTTGAGDYFGGAFLHAFLEGRSPAASAAFATAASSLAIGRDKGANLAPQAVVQDLADTLLTQAERVA